VPKKKKEDNLKNENLNDISGTYILSNSEDYNLIFDIEKSTHSEKFQYFLNIKLDYKLKMQYKNLNMRLRRNVFKIDYI
jgi:hypothetical protein